MTKSPIEQAREFLKDAGDTGKLHRHFSPIAETEFIGLIEYAESLARKVEELEKPPVQQISYDETSGTFKLEKRR